MSEPLQIGMRPSLVAGPWRFAAAGLAASGLVWIVIDRAYPFWSDHTGEVTGGPPNVALMALVPQIHYQNIVAICALIGGILGLGMALAEGAARRCLRFVLLGALSSVVLGSGAGAVAGCAAQKVEKLPLGDLIDLAQSMAAQAVLWTIVGLGAGLGVVLPTRRLRLMLIGPIAGAAGGFVSTLLYGPLVAIAFSMSDTDALVPEDSICRLVWLVVPALIIGLVLGGSGRAPRVMEPISGLRH